MCLDTVDKEVKKTKGYGWKVFRKAVWWKEGTGLYPEFCLGRKTESYPVNEWIKDKRVRRIGAGDGSSYPPGFHIFNTRKEAELWVEFVQGRIIRKVEYDNVVATGQQSPMFIALGVIVARKMKIIEKGGG